MANQVFANGMEVSCKAADGKSICAFPDVCFTPPQTPATPPGVPIPYPNTGLASDTSDGSTTVKISGQEVMLKNKSYFKKSTGDEAGCAPMKGVVTHKITGKVYFKAWSMDVVAEGENVVRAFDLTTHNHASEPGQIATIYTDEAFMSAIAAGGDSLPKCECCGGHVHSKAQANCDSISEDDFYSGHPDGAEWLKMARESCPGIVPAQPPTADPCAKYYKGIRSTKSPRAEYSQAGANPLSNPNSLPHIHGKGQMAHRVPLAAGGCPVGKGNVHPVAPGPCKALEDMSSDIHGDCMKFWG